MRSQKGIATVAIIFISLFSAVGGYAASKIPARQQLKTKLIAQCVANNETRKDCKAFVDRLTQKEREALGRGDTQMVYAKPGIAEDNVN